MRTFLLLIFSTLALNLVIAQTPSLPKAVGQEYQLALLTARQGNHKGALEAIRNIINDASLLPYWQKRLAADTLFLRGTMDYEKRSMPSAERFLKQALDARIQMFGENDSSVAETYSRLGMMYRRSGDFPQSEISLQKALDIQRAVLGSDNVIVAYSLNNLGNLYKSRNQPENAIKYYDDALHIYQSLTKDSLRFTGEGMTYLNYAILNHRFGAYAKAEAQVIAGLTQYKAVYGSMHKELGRFWFELARLAIDQSDFSQSLIYADSTSQAWQSAEVPEYLYIKIIQGIAHAERGDYEQAEEYQLLALSEMQAREMNNPMTLSGIYSNLANIALLQENVAESEAYLNQSIQLSASVLPPGDPVFKTHNYLLGQINFKKKAFDKAIYHFKLALAEAPGRSPEEIPENGAVYETLGVSYAEKGEFDVAFTQFALSKNCFEKAGLVNHIDYARLYEKIGHAYSQNQQFAKANQAMKKGREILGYDFAIESAQKLPPLHSPYSRNVLLENLQASARVYRAQAQHNNHTPTENQVAWQALQLAVSLIDSMRLSFRSHGAKALLHERIFPIYSDAISVAWQNYQVNQDPYWLEQAFQMSERNKSMILFESLRDHQAQKFGGIPDSILQKERRISLDLALIEKQLFELENANDPEQVSIRGQLLALRAKYDTFISKLENTYPEYFTLKYAPNSVAITNIQSQLQGADQAWVSYFMGKEQTYAFVIQSGSIDWIEIGPSEALSKMVENLIRTIPTEQQRDGLALANISHQLYSQLVAALGELPLEMVIIPDGILGYVPFDLLLTHSPNAQLGFKDWPYLLHQHQLSYAYSSTLHLEQVQSQSRRKLQTKVLAFAPSFPSMEQAQFASSRRQLSPLAHNQSEVNQLSRYFSGQTYLAAAASEGEFKQQAASYDIIHIASHALVNDQNPLYSHINFTPGADSLEDGVLELAELFNLQLQAEMVVLSACETGLGKLQQGEGIVSLARGMSYAGANSVLTTLWQVNDAATADLMARFYAELDQGESKDAALRNAKIAYLSESDQLSAHPFYWAAYVPIGDMRPLTQTNWSIIFLLLGLGFALLAGVYWIKKRK
ncbi:MAG: CHAT domain-containing protein [Bacteroidia bacterium]